MIFNKERKTQQIKYVNGINKEPRIIHSVKSEASKKSQSQCL